MKTIYFVRHGESEGNVARTSQGIKTPLTDTGHKQAKRLAERCKDLEITKIYTSDMTRAIDTGDHIAQTLDLEPESSPLFREWMTPASVQGKTYDSPEYQAFSTSFKQSYTDPNWRYEDAENFHDLLKRGKESVAFLECSPEDKILVVSHGKYMRFLLALIIHQENLTPELHMQIYGSVRESNTGITVFIIKDTKEWNLITWNDHAHFAE